MQERIKFTLFPEPAMVGKSNELPKKVFDKCVERWPRFKKRGRVGFTIDALSDSSELKEIIEFIEEQAGKIAKWSRFTGVFDDFKSYQLEGIRHFDLDEIEKADYCWCIPKKIITKSGYRHDDGILEVERGSIMAQSIGSTISGFTVLCTESIRQEIEKEGFVNVEFKPVNVSGKKPPKEPLWEISGHTHLPPVTNKLVNDRGEKPDDSARGCWVDDLFFPPLLTYNQNSLAKAVGGFDVGVTTEKWHSGIIARRSPFLICSKRFRLWCQDRGLKLDWVPVHMLK
jgi:hypothetical protein